MPAIIVFLRNQGVAMKISLCLVMILTFLSCGKDSEKYSLTQNIQNGSCSAPQTTNFNYERYYARINSQTGDSLKKTLNSIIKGHYKYSYNCAKTIIAESDEDPNNHNNLITFYSRKSIAKSNGGWNREHVWAKSHGFKNPSAHAYSDAHHLRPTFVKINSLRGSKDFDNGGTSVGGSCQDCLATETTWEVPDAVKGDVARIMLYMSVRYEGDDNSNTPDLELVNRTTSPGEPVFGNICNLLAWNALDPISPEERHRNEVVYQWQKNRNPFIDNPEWITKIWGNVEDCR